MNSQIEQIVHGFQPITLEQLNAKAAMLERLDNKYILRAAELQTVLDIFAGFFDVLEIDGQRAFVYATRYFDDPDQHAYYDHHQGRRRRCKVRVREYIDAGVSYLEVKLKDKRSITIKKRLRLSAPENGLDHAGVDFVETCHRDLYEQPFGRILNPAIDMQYKRITLVAKHGGERMTIDTALHFEAAEVACAVHPDMFIVETKSARGNGIADKLMRRYQLHPTNCCSKYCIGMIATRQVTRHNRFLPALRRLGLVAGPDPHFA